MTSIEPSAIHPIGDEMVDQGRFLRHGAPDASRSPPSTRSDELQPESRLRGPRSSGTRFDGALRASPAVSRSLDGIRAFWTTLVDSFCEAIEPLLGHWFPEDRLVFIADEAGDLALHRVSRGVAAALGPLAALESGTRSALASTRWSAVELRLPAGQVLQRSLTLPGAGRDFLGPIIEHRLERLTPWAPGKVLYGYRVEGEKGGTSLAVTLVAASRDAVAGLLTRLEAAGFTATAIGVTSPDPVDEAAIATPLSINIIGTAAMPLRARSARLVSRTVLATTILLFCACTATAISASHAASAQGDAARKLLKARRLLRIAQLGGVGADERTMLLAKQPTYSAMVLLDRMAAALPSDTYLRELNLTPDKLRIVGSTAEAPALIAKLEAIGLGNVRFSSAIAREKDGRDSFEIVADRAVPASSDQP